jgi:[ribosomal protein S5]-alanine N-acetyltransferase
MLETSRLKLVPLTHEQLILYKTNQKELAHNLGVHFLDRQNDPSVETDLAEAIEFWIKNTSEKHEHYEWYTNWEIILKDENIAVGGIGFAGLPDEDGKSMVGYGLDVRFHNRGIVSEALSTIIEWGFLNPSLKQIIADTPLQNLPSQKVLIKNGFSESHRTDSLIFWKLNR